MNLRLICNYLGRILRVEGLLMIPALLIAVFYDTKKDTISFLITIVVVVVFGYILTSIKPRTKTVYAREGFAVVALSWIMISVFGALPLFLSGCLTNPIDCFFEIVSGFTTTGASVIADIESMAYSIKYWRSFTHWIGGMGVLVFILAVMPMAGGVGGSMRILRAESPGPSVGKLVPKMHNSARILYAMYIAMTFIEFILLICGGMPVFDSLLNSFATAGTGGFAIKNISIAAYDSYYLQSVITVFMLLFGINFNIYYLILLKDFKSVLKNQELRLFLTIVIISIVAITINTMDMYDNLYQAFHHSAFQVSSIISTTGFSTVDFNLWPPLSKCILLLLMMIGGCAGSTGGGFKVERVLLLGKVLRSYIKKLLHPRSVYTIKSSGQKVGNSVIEGVSVFLIAYIFIIGLSLVLVALDEKSIETTISSVIACINNVGPGFDDVGPMSNFSSFSNLSKIVLSIDMLFGRLEIFPLLLIFTPGMWKRVRYSNPVGKFK